MSKQKQCIDFYGEKLKVGDEVISILEEALSIGGIISKIEYNEKYNNHYITITDKEGNILREGVDTRCYTTQARYDERKKQEYVYSLTFYNQRFLSITTIPLTNRTDLEYEIPDETCFVTIDARHLQKKGYQLTENSWSYPSYDFSSIYYFIVDGKAKLCHDKDDDLYYLLNFETYDWHSIGNNYRFFNNNEELKKYVKGIIGYFNDADLTYVHNNVEFDKNENGKDFEKNLIYTLKH